MLTCANRKQGLWTVLTASRIIYCSRVCNGDCNRTKVAIILDQILYDPRIVKNGVTISSLSLALMQQLCENEIYLDMRNINNLRIDS